jgi:hypothetical protein
MKKVLDCQENNEWIQDNNISFFQQMGKNTSLLFQLSWNGCLKVNHLERYHLFISQMWKFPWLDPVQGIVMSFSSYLMLS